MTKLFKTALTASALVLATAAPTWGQSMSLCLPHKDAVAKLGQDYREHQVGVGLGQRGDSVVELFVSEAGTWTVLVTRTNGLACIAASGDNWMTKPILAGDPA